VTNGPSQWTTRPPLHHARAGLAGATVDGDILAIGGFTFDLGNFDFVEARRIEGNGQWQDLPALPTRRANLSAAELDGFVYAVGGIDENDQALDVVERYDPQPPSWAPSPSLPEPRVAPGVVGFDHLLYVAGGEIPRGPGGPGEASNSVITFNPQNGEWKPVASMPTRRSRLRLVAAGDHLYAIGGISQARQALSSVDRYHPGSDTWDQVASMNEARGLPGAVVIGSERIVVVGGGGGKFGAGNFIVRRSSEIYNVGPNGQWQMLDALLPHGRVSLVSALEDDGTVLAIGGAVANGDPPTATNLVEALDLG
jgi:N-acetylneuraminic acid mutarotase